jgi:uncharacterized membrane protein (DUF106 family)
MYGPLVQWCRKRMQEQEGPIDLPQLTEEAMEIFAKDPKFLRTQVYPLVYTQLRAVLAATRGESPVRVVGGSV